MSGEGILAGVRVLDFSRYIAGPYCAALLGHLGADVIRVERPEGGEDRYVGPLSRSASAVFMQTGCNKRSLTLDLKHPRASELIARLVASADVVIANMTPAALAAAGLDYASLTAIKPDIILTTQTAFGHDGPWRDRGGYDGLGQVMSGSAWLSGTQGQPARCATPYVDFSTAALGAFGTLAALHQRRTTGQGQQVQACLLGSALAAFNAPLVEQAVLGVNRAPSGNRGQTSAPTDVFATRDGHVITQVVGNSLFKRLARAIGRPDWGGHPGYESDFARGERRDEICAEVAAWCAVHSSDEVVECLAAAGVPCGPVLDLDAALTHAQTRAMGFLGTVEYPEFAGAAPVARFPLHMSGVKAPQARPPLIGEHTDAVLAEIGYAPHEIAALHAAGAV